MMNRTGKNMEDAWKRLEELEHRRRMEKHCEAKKKKKDDARRYSIIGKLVCEYFPELMKCQPRRSEAENREEFSDLRKILELAAGNAEHLGTVKKLGGRYGS